MASQNLNVGTAANANDGDTLRAAFINVRKMFHEIYGISATYADNLDLSTGGETFAESVQDIIGGMVSGNTESNITVTYDDSNNKLNFSVAADITDINTEANSGLAGGVDDGNATLTLDLNNLTVAAVNVANDSIGIIDASDSNASRKESIADLMTAVAGSGITATSGVLSVDSIGTDGITNDAVTPQKVNLLADDLAATDAHIMIADGTDFSNFAMSGDATLSNAGLLTIGNDKITYAKLGARFTASSAVTAAADTEIDFDDASIYTITSSIAVDLRFENEQIGDVKTIIITDSGGSSSLTFDTGTNTVTTLNGTYDATSGTVNFIQVICTASNTFFVTISQ